MPVDHGPTDAPRHVRLRCWFAGHRPIYTDLARDAYWCRCRRVSFAGVWLYARGPRHWLRRQRRRLFRPPPW